MKSLLSFFLFCCASAFLTGCDPKPAATAATSEPSAQTDAEEPRVEVAVEEPDVTPAAPPDAVGDSKEGADSSSEHSEEHVSKLLETPGGKVFKRMSDFYQSQETLKFHAKQETKVEVDGADPQTVTSRCDFVSQKPNRFALRRYATGSGPDLFSNGELLTAYSPTLNRFTEEPAPESIADVLGTEVAELNESGIQSSILLSLAIDNLADVWLEEVESVNDLGEVELDGQKTSFIELRRPDRVLKAWIDAGEEPWLRRVEIRITAEVSSPEDAVYTHTLTLSNQSGKVSGLETAFVFHPPIGSVKSSSLSLMSLILESMPQRNAEAEIHPLVGQMAPEVELKTLSGEDFKLSDVRGKKVVMLDFWATWCPPCVRELPILTEVAAEFENRDVLFVGANQGEDAETIQEFLEKSKLKFEILLDSDGTAGESYQVQGIPMLVLIDKQGKIQAVHVGFSPKIGDTLRTELNSILEGVDLAEEAKAKQQAAMNARLAEIPNPDGLKVVSTRPIDCSSAVQLPSGEMIVSSKGKLLAIPQAGEEHREVATLPPGSELRFAKRSSSGEAMLLHFERWGQTLAALDLEGKTLWEETGGQGVNDVAAADLDGDGVDEIVVGYNGGTGVHVFDASGKRLWSNTDIGNVWFVAAGNVTGDEKLEVVTTSAAGTVHIYSADGKPLKTIDVPVYASMVRTGKPNPEDAYDTIFVSGPDGENAKTVAINYDGDVLWEALHPPGSKFCRAAEICSSAPWLAQLIEGTLTVIDTRTGEFLGGAVVTSGPNGNLKWISPADGHSRPRLLVAAPSGLSIYEVVENSEDRSEDEPAADSPKEELSEEASRVP